MILAKLGTLLNLDVNSPVLYFLKNDVGNDNTRIIVASVTDFSILIEMRLLTNEKVSFWGSKQSSTIYEFPSFLLIAMHKILGNIIILLL